MIFSIEEIGRLLILFLIFAPEKKFYINKQQKITKMKKMKFMALILSGALMLGSCGMNNTAKGGLIGGGGGAALGGAVYPHRRLRQTCCQNPCGPDAGGCVPMEGEFH